MNFPVFDLHCDTVLAMVGPKFYAEGTLRHNQFHIDLERAAKYPGYAQCFALYSSPLIQLPKKMTMEDLFERELSVLLREINGNGDIIAQAYSAEDIIKNRDKGIMSAIFTIEGPAGFGYDPALLQDLYDIGFRISNLGWNESNPLTGSCMTGEGLTDQGREYVKEAQRLGMRIDVSHISDQGFWDICDITQAPILATHSNSRTVFDHCRNLTDEMFLEICRTGGVAGINLGAMFIGDQPGLDQVCDHIFHFMELDPTGKHISLGGDLDGVEELPAEFTGVESFDALAQRLLQRGLTNDQVQDLYWNNALGVI